jgi:hypothetical protein
MDLKEIMAVSGYPGLYKFISQGRSGIIVESLVDQKRTNVPASAKVSSMGDIAVFTDGEDVPLHRVFQAIKDKHNAGAAINPKQATDEDLKTYFAELLPSYDRERVYMSDIKKVIAWYNILQQNGILDFDVKEEEAEENAAPAAEGEQHEAAPKKATAKKPTAAKTAAKTAAAKPVKQATSKAAGSAGKINAPRKAQ